ncbi:MAG TPA: hypothetical protein VLA84_22350 [Microcoleus sp.]|nr:hypothetical protein [Microcoleus sp.]
MTKYGVSLMIGKPAIGELRLKEHMRMADSALVRRLVESGTAVKRVCHINRI